MGELAEQHRELVAPQPGDGVVTPGAGLQPFGHLHQQLVADAVAQTVVDGLEVVEVEEHHRRGGPLLGHPLRHLGQLLA